MDNIFLLLLLVIPAAGAVVGALLPNARFAKCWGLFVSLVTFGVAVGMAGRFLRSGSGSNSDDPITGH